MLISGLECDTVIDIPVEYRGRVLAYVLNQHELAYGIFYPDERSIDFFERCLGNSTSAMLQLSIINQFFTLMQSARYNPLGIGRLLN